MNCLSQDPAYSRLKDYLLASTGLDYFKGRDTLLRDVIGERLSELGLRDCSCYAKLLADGEAGSAELDILISHLTIGETYFFRDERQFGAIRDIILPDILERKQSTMQLRIWSAGCSSGAEPYSLAILLARDLADRIAGWEVGIFATDLNRQSLAQAAEGKFGKWALRSTSDEVKRECFSNDGRVWTIHPRYRQWISFHHLNLAGNRLSTPWPAGNHFDLILCRNVMIYFGPEMRRRVIQRFHQSLDDKGWLVVGACEHNLENYTAFRTANATGTRLYQKLAVPCEQVESRPLKMPPPDAVASPVPPDGPWRITLLESLAKLPVDPSPADIEGLRQLADCGDWQGAAEYGQRLLSQDRLNPSIHFYQALIFENLGIVDEAERSLRQAIYLDRRFALAHYHLGLVLNRDGQRPAATRSFGNVLKVLAGMADDAAVTAGPEVTVPELKKLARMQLEESSGS